MADTVYDKTLVRRTISPATLVNGTVNGAAVDRATHGGCEEAMLVVQTGTVTDGSHAVVLEDSDNGTSGWAAVSVANIQGAIAAIVAANDDAIFELGVGASRRFLRAVITTTGATTGGVIGATVVLGDVRQLPVSHS